MAIAGETLERGGYEFFGARYILGGDRELIANVQINGTLGKLAETNLRTLKVN